MKTTVLILSFLISFCLVSNAQENGQSKQKGKIGVTFSTFGNIDVLSFAKGGPGYSGNQFFTIGINYMYSLKNWLDIESGIEYSDYSITIHPNLPPDNNNTPYTEKFSLINIPVILRVNFLKYFFVNGGLLLDIDAGKSSSINSQNGIGLNFGLGLKYDSKIGLSIFANPYIKTHSIISFSSEQNHDRLIESGIRFGLMYKLK